MRAAGVWLLKTFMLSYAHEQKEHGYVIDRCGQQDAVFVMLVGFIK
jgi:hypothetical protein